MNKQAQNHPINRHQWSIGQRMTDKLTKIAGSWTFIIVLVLFILIWTSINVYEIIEGLDPYPFILLNLLLSVTTTILTPIILMSQNRATQKDRIRAEYDYLVNKKSEKEIEEIKKQLNRIEKRLK